MNKDTTSYKVGQAAILAALAMIFSYIEATIPFHVGIPGVKLGITNLVIIITLYRLGFKYAIIVNIVRILVVGFLFTGVFGILYAMSGGLISLAVMGILKKSGAFSVIGVSLAGGVFHNLGQILMAAFIVSNAKIFVYFPLLIFSGLISGTLIGILTSLIMSKLDKANI